MKVIDTPQGKAVESAITTTKTELKEQLTQQLSVVNKQIESLTNQKKSIEFKLGMITDAEKAAEPVEEEIKQ